MSTRNTRCAATSLVIVLSGLLGFGAAGAAAKPVTLLTVQGELAKHQSQSNTATAADTSEGIVPPAAPCPQNGLTPQVAVSGIGLIPNCGIPELPIAAGEPYPGTMSYYGGHVQVHPKEYLVLWGWGLPGAFNGNPAAAPVAAKCTSETLTEGLKGSIKATLPCDPDHAGLYMANFVNSIGGSQWAEVQDQYYNVENGVVQHIDESGNVLAGIWVDDSAPTAELNPNLQKTSSTNPAGPTNTYSEMALEASAAAAHFKQTTRSQLANDNFIIAQPQSFSDPQAANQDSGSLVGYCAFHDYTDKNATGNAYYNVKTIADNISYTNMPYTLNAGAGCGQGFVNSGNTPGSDANLDAFSIGLGHEIEETATDPGAEDVENNITTGGTRYLGGWYDTLDGNENGDKCAYVGLSPLAGLAGPNILPIPGAMNNVTFPDKQTFAVQSLWSDAAAFGTGWCAGAADDFPGSPGEPPYS